MAQSTFDPAQHLSSIKGQDYLEVKWRLAWLRSEHPDAVITTQLETHLDDRAIFSARVEVPEGGSATGWGSETASSFGNYIEKAETKAIGRALAALGFGTQFCLDFDDGPETGVLADAPVQLRRQNQRPAPQEQRAQSQEPMTEKQKGMVIRTSGKLGIPTDKMDEISRSITGTAFLELTKSSASKLIDELLRRENEAGAKLAS